MTSFRTLCLFLCGLAFGMSLTGVTFAEDSGAATHIFHWQLPKTVLDVSVTYTPTGCNDDDTTKAPIVTMDVAVTVAARQIADPLKQGGAFPNERIEVPAESLESFWKTNKIAVNTYPSGILKALGATPADQTSTIVGNIFSTISKAVPMVAGGLASGTVAAQASHGKCGSALAKIESDKKQLKGKLSQQAQTALSAEIMKSQSDSAVKMDVTIDPGTTAGREAPNQKTGTVDQSFPIAVVTPEEETVAKKGWYDKDAELAVFGAKKAPDWDVNVYITIPKPYSGTLKSLPADTLFRDSPRCLVEAYLGKRGAEGNVTNRKSSGYFGFGQFGIPEKLPLRAGIFESYDWSVSFTEDGVVTDSSFNSTASGVAATNLLGAAATSANATETSVQKAANEDSELARLTAENNLLQAQINNINDKNQLAKLQAQQAGGSGP